MRPIGVSFSQKGAGQRVVMSATELEYLQLEAFERFDADGRKCSWRVIWCVTRVSNHLLPVTLRELQDE
jgi:hypothetical protein